MAKTHTFLLLRGGVPQRALWNTPLKSSCRVWFPNSEDKENKHEGVFIFYFYFVLVACVLASKSEFSLVKSAPKKGSEMLKSPLLL